VLVEHFQKILDMRRHLTMMEGKIDSTVQTTLRNIETNGNPYGMGFSTRGDWAKGLGIKTLAEDAGVDYLYYVGCAGSFDDRNKKVAAAFVNVLLNVGVRVGILGEEETCCGDSALRLGNEYLFQTLAKQNIETFRKYGVRRIVSACPHCFNIFRKEYRQLGGEFEVFHHSELLYMLAAEGRLKLSVCGDGARRVAIHDSCYLGRYNGVYEAPRRLAAAVAKVAEPEKRRSKSFCCGGGGGRMWMEEKLGTRINHMRFDELVKTGAGEIATCCPFCLTMFSDAIRDKGMEGKIRALDIAEITASSSA
jgi:Fe-S oxidoreductase